MAQCWKCFMIQKYLHYCLISSILTNALHTMYSLHRNETKYITRIYWNTCPALLWYCKMSCCSVYPPESTWNMDLVSSPQQLVSQSWRNTVKNIIPQGTHNAHTGLTLVLSWLLLLPKQLGVKVEKLSDRRQTNIHIWRQSKLNRMEIYLTRCFPNTEHTKCVLIGLQQEKNTYGSV